jgi:WD repeat-containing protein 42A
MENDANEGVDDKDEEFEDASEELPIHVDDKSLELLKGGKEKNDEHSKSWIEEGSCSKNKEVDSDAKEAENDAIISGDVIDLRPKDSSSESEDGPECNAAMFKKRKHSHTRKYRKKEEEEEEGEESSASSSSDEKVPGEEEEAAGPSAPPLTGADLVPSYDTSDEESERPRSRVKARRIVRAADLVSSDDDEDNNADDYNDNNSSSTEEDGATNDVDITEQTKAVVFKDVSKPKHNIILDLKNLQLGLKMTPSFSQRRCASVDTVKRLKLAYKLPGHEGCVNSLHFNQSGSLIASGSDDLNIIVWEWEKRRKMVQFNSGHKANVFQSKLMPGDLLITSCSRDGQVRLAELSVTGAVRSTKKLGQHKGPAHKMSLLPDCPYVLLSAGEDGQVLSVDIREQKPDKILLLKNEKDKKIPIYSIHSSPSNGNWFCTSGRDQFVRLFDRRFLSRDGGQVVRFCPDHLKDNDSFKAYITCAVFSEDGREVIGSYNDEDIYLFNTADPEGSSHVHRYQGHRNSATVKGVNFYGPNSEYIISGSDCGNIFLWDKQTEGLVKLMPGDDNGVVNVLEPHPTLPVLATSGLDDEVKLWLPLEVTGGPGQCWQTDQKEYMLKTVQRNLNDRETQRNSEPDPLDGQMLWVLWRHIRRAERRRREAAAARGEEEALSDADSSEEEEDESDGEEGPRGRMCAQS